MGSPFRGLMFGLLFSVPLWALIGWLGFTIVEALTP